MEGLEAAVIGNFLLILYSPGRVRCKSAEHPQRWAVAAEASCTPPTDWEMRTAFAWLCAASGPSVALQ